MAAIFGYHNVLTKLMITAVRHHRTFTVDIRLVLKMLTPAIAVDAAGIVAGTDLVLLQYFLYYVLS